MLNWLAPATVCMLLAGAALRQENGISSQPPRHDPAVVMMLSNVSSVPYLTGGPSQVEHNVSSRTLEWTNRSGSTLNSGFTPSAKSTE